MIDRYDLTKLNTPGMLQAGGEAIDILVRVSELAEHQRYYSHSTIDGLRDDLEKLHAAILDGKHASYVVAVRNDRMAIAMDPDVFKIPRYDLENTTMPESRILDVFWSWLALMVVALVLIGFAGPGGDLAGSIILVMGCLIMGVATKMADIRRNLIELFEPDRARVRKNP